MEVEELESLRGPDISDVDFTRILAKDKKGCAIFETFSSEGPSEFLVVSRMRWDEQRNSSSSSSGRQWQAGVEERRVAWRLSERKVIGAVEDYLERGADIKVDVEALERSMEPEEVEVCLRYILKYSTGRGSNIFQLFDTKEKKDHFVASRMRWLEHQGGRGLPCKKVGIMNGMTFECQGIMAEAPPCPERTLTTPLSQQSSSSSRDEESQWTSGEDRHRRRVAFEETAKRMLRYPEDSEVFEVGVTELQEQLGISEEAGVSIREIAREAMNEDGQKIFEIFSQGEEEVCIASLARWNAQLKGLVELEKRCQNMMREVKFSSERQEVLKGMVEDKIRLQSRATEKYYEQIFEEMKELEEKKSKEALLLVQKKHILMRY